MSKLEVDAIEPQSGTTLTLGASGDTITIPSGATFTSTGIDDNATSTAITIDSSENIGIGTSSPTALLELFKAGTTQIKNAYSSTKYSLFGRTSGNYYWSSYEGGANLIFSTSGSDDATTERMCITSSGGVDVGSEGTGGTAIGLNVHNHGWSTMATFKTGTSTDAQYVQFINSNGVVGSINMSGSSTSYNTSSDHRLKENVDYTFDATTRLKQLKPARFNFITDATKTVDGFIAHEVSSVVPEAISGAKDAVEDIGNITDADNNIIKENVTEPDTLEDGQTWIKTETKPVHQGIDQSKLVPLLVKTIQELEARITTLENA